MNVFSVVLRVSRLLIGNWTFARAMARRNIQSLNIGSVIGVGWMVLRPLFLVLTYVVIVTFVFRVRLGEDVGRFDYALYILSGLVIWQLVAKVIESSASLLVEKMETLKQVVYPIDTLPVTLIIQEASLPVVGYTVFLLIAAFTGNLHLSAVLLPIPLAIAVFMMLGLSWIMMIVGLVFRDLKNIVSVVLSILIFMSPVLISEKMIPEWIWQLLLINPLAHVVISFRDVLYATFHPVSWMIFIGLAAFLFVFGAVLIDRMRLAINDYI